MDEFADYGNAQCYSLMFVQNFFCSWGKEQYIAIIIIPG